MEPKQNKLSAGKKMGYAIGQGGDSLGFNVFYFFFLFFLTDIAGLPPAVAGTVSLIAVVWDAITDPIIGHISDNLKSRHGRRRPVMLTAAIPYSICMFLLFNNVDMSVGAKSAYFIIVAMLFWTTYTMYVIPYFALGAELTQDFDERTNLRVWASVIMQLAVMLASAAPPMIVAKSQEAGMDIFQGWRNVGILFAIILLVIILICCAATKGGELPREEALIKKEDRKNIFRTILDVFKLKPAKSLAASIFCWSLVTSMASSGPVYIMTNNLQFSPGKQSTFFVINTLIAIAWLPVVNILSTKMGKKKAYILTMLAGGIGISAFAIIGITGFTTLVIWAALFQFGNAAFWTLYYSMMYDLSELDEFKNGTRREGIITALMAFCQKLGAAVAMWLTGVILQMGHYDGSLAVQPDSALDAIIYANTIIPGVIGVLAAVFAVFYPLTGERFKALTAALEAKRNGREYTTDGFEKLL